MAVRVKKAKISSGSPFFWLVIFLFILGIANYFYFNIAQNSYTGIVDSDVERYNNGFLYEEGVVNRHKQISFHKVGNLKISAINRSLLVYFTFKTESGSPIVGAEVSLKIMRPVTYKEDLLLHLQEEKPGVYVAKLPSGMIGQWDFKVIAKKEEETFYMQQRLILHYEESE